MIRLDRVWIEARSGRDPGRALLSDVSLSIGINEYVVLVGPNGSGKSLLLNTLAGLLKPAQGTVIFEQTDINALDQRPEIGIVFQSPDDQIVGSTVERDLAFGLENRGVPPAEIRRKVDDSLRAAGMGGLADRAPHLLSDGEKQRLALAGALIGEPRLLLLDEPTARLDPPGRRELRQRIRDVRRSSGAAVVLVTHRSEEIVTADRILGLREGRLVFDGTPEELLASSEVDALGILWTRGHRFLRAAAAPIPPGEAWNDPDRWLAGLETA